MTRKALYDFELLETKSNIAIALSGGKDSLTLLKMLCEISGKGFNKLNLLAIHVNGAFSCGAGISGTFLADFCKELNVPLIIKNADQNPENLKCYSCSRERRKLIFSAAKEQGFDTIAFGHHRDDHVQTLLMNLLHKAEFAGNLPKIYLEDYQVTLIRPLIYVCETMIKNYSVQQGFARIMCRCPVGQTSQRKKTEELVLELEKIFPNARTNLASAGLIYGSQKAAKK